MTQTLNVLSDLVGMGGTNCLVLVFAVLLFSFYYTVGSVNSDTCNAADGNGAWMGDGACDPQNLIPECAWGGGDCCRCTCVDEKFACGNDGFLCVDPDVLDDDLASCEKFVARPPCSGDGQRHWLVSNANQAQALAEAVNCSGGTFDVEWRGSIIVDTEILVIDGTVLNITGVGSRAVLDGGGKTRLFRLVNASLQLTDLEVRNGTATFGGAIAAMDSNLTISRSSFLGNTAQDKNGGAMFVYGGSHVFFDGETGFFNNSSNNYGGALFVVNSSVVWNGVSTFSVNSASHSGGALYTAVGSTVSWQAETTFRGNIARTYNGGALLLESSSKAS